MYKSANKRKSETFLIPKLSTYALHVEEIKK